MPLFSDPVCPIRPDNRAGSFCRIFGADQPFDEAVADFAIAGDLVTLRPYAFLTPVEVVDLLGATPAMAKSRLSTSATQPSRADRILGDQRQERL